MRKILVTEYSIEVKPYKGKQSVGRKKENQANSGFADVTKKHIYLK